VAYVQPASRLRLVTRAARMYHEQGLKQPQIAELLHVSQAKVSRLLKRAEELGIVRVVIVPPPGGHSELEEALVARYGLLDAVVADAPSGDEKAITSAVGVGGPRKHSAIRAAVLGGWVNLLVTDVDTAEALLA
jgi:DNA-binding transcriptional regulator LsrR (DeoR family)